MMTTTRLISALLLPLVLAACASAPITQAPPKANVFDLSQDSSHYLNSAKAALLKYEQDNNLKHLFQAKVDYKAGLALQPDDLNLQHGNYLTNFRLAAAGFVTTEKLTELYNALHPEIKPNLASPYRMAYIHARSKKISGKPMVNILLDALANETDDEYLWSGLSKEMGKLNYPLFSAALAQKAAPLAPLNADYVIATADALSEAYWQTSCPKDNAKLALKSLKYFLAADKLTPNNAYILNQIGANYTFLGLPPLALRYTKKAYEVSANQWTAFDYAYALFYNKQYDEAKRVGEELLNKHNRRNGLDVLALLSFIEGDTAKASELAQQSIKNYESSGAELLVWHWLAYLGSTEQNFAAIASIPAEFGLSQEVLDYLRAETTFPMPLAEESNSCDQSIAAFANGIKLLSLGQKSQAKTYFEKVKSLKHSGFAEYDYSLAILENWQP